MKFPSTGNCFDSIYLFPPSSLFFRVFVWIGTWKKFQIYLWKQMRKFNTLHQYYANEPQIPYKRMNFSPVLIKQRDFFEGSPTSRCIWCSYDSCSIFLLLTTVFSNDTTIRLFHIWNTYLTLGVFLCLQKVVLALRVSSKIYLAERPGLETSVVYQYVFSPVSQRLILVYFIILLCFPWSFGILGKTLVSLLYRLLVIFLTCRLGIQSRPWKMFECSSLSIL